MTAQTFGGFSFEWRPRDWADGWLGCGSWRRWRLGLCGPARLLERRAACTGRCGSCLELGDPRPPGQGRVWWGLAARPPAQRGSIALDSFDAYAHICMHRLAGSTHSTVHLHLHQPASPAPHSPEHPQWCAAPPSPVCSSLTASPEFSLQLGPQTDPVAQARPRGLQHLDCLSRPARPDLGFDRLARPHHR